MLRAHLIEKKNEKVMMIQNRKKIQDRENNHKMEELDAKLMQKISPDLLAAKKLVATMEDESEAN